MKMWVMAVAAVILTLTCVICNPVHHMKLHLHQTYNADVDPSTTCIRYDIKDHIDKIPHLVKNITNKSERRYILGECNYTLVADYNGQREPKIIPTRICKDECLDNKCSNEYAHYKNKGNNIQYSCTQIYTTHKVLYGYEVKDELHPSNCLCVSKKCDGDDCGEGKTE